PRPRPGSAGRRGGGRGQPGRALPGDGSQGTGDRSEVRGQESGPCPVSCPLLPVFWFGQRGRRTMMLPWAVSCQSRVVATGDSPSGAGAAASARSGSGRAGTSAVEATAPAARTTAPAAKARAGTAASKRLQVGHIGGVSAPGASRFAPYISLAIRRVKSV